MLQANHQLINQLITQLDTHMNHWLLTRILMIIKKVVHIKMLFQMIRINERATICPPLTQLIIKVSARALIPHPTLQQPTFKLDSTLRALSSLVNPNPSTSQEPPHHTLMTKTCKLAIKEALISTIDCLRDQLPQVIQPVIMQNLL